MHHIGYRTAFERMQHLRSPAVITLDVAPPVLPEVVVAAKPICPNQDDAAARALWLAMQSRYLQVPDAATVGTGFFAYESSVSPSDLGRFKEHGDGYSVKMEQKGGRSLFAVSIGRDGYARRPPAGVMLSSEFESWEYVRLGSTSAGHFVDDAFARAHTFSTLPDEGEEQRLAFCPRDKKKPRIEGVLTLRADSSLAQARWRFRVPERDDAASGEAAFPPLTSERGYLHPVSSTFWRNDRFPGKHYQRLERYGIWRVGTSAELQAMVAEWHRVYESKR